MFSAILGGSARREVVFDEAFLVADIELGENASVWARRPAAAMRRVEVLNFIVD